jgi:anti-sigma factor RsiW
MTTETRHFREEIQELLDDRLNAELRLEVEKHIELCEPCRTEMQALRWTRNVSHKQFAPEAMPAKVEENILLALDLEDRRLSNHMVFSWLKWRKRRTIFAFAFLLIAAVALVLGYFIFRAPLQGLPELPSEVARDYRNYQTERLPLLLKTEDVNEMEKFFSESELPFQTRVFDLAMMGYRLTGGRVHQLINRQSALFVYRKEGNKILVCQMYPGRVTELPTGALLRESKGIRFFIYRVNGLTLVFWQEGVITCVLASDIDSEEVIQLAFAKAVKI